MFFAFNGLVILSMLAGAPMLPRPAAAADCSSFQAMCAARCKQRNPGDADCVSDHCTPKLQECRSTGCWQEGRLYGGATTCKLRKS